MGKHAVSTAGQRFKRNVFSHNVSRRILHSINRSQFRIFLFDCRVILCIGINRSGKAVNNWNGHFPACPGANMEFCILKLTVFIIFCTVTSRKTKFLLFLLQSVCLRKFHCYRFRLRKIHTAGHRIAIAFYGKGIRAKGQIQFSIMIGIRPLFAISILYSNCYAGKIVIRIILTLVCKSDFIGLTTKNSLIVVDCICQ